MSPWKYSWNRIWSFQCGSVWNRSAPPKTGRRPVYGGTEKFQSDPHWRDLILFYEYFHGDNGAGIGASHQTGWTGVIAWIMKSLVVLDPKEVLAKGFDAAAMKMISGH